MKAKNYYGVESIGINSASNRRHCAVYMRFSSQSERDEWVGAKNNRSAIKSSDSDLRHDCRMKTAFWDTQKTGEMLIA